MTAAPVTRSQKLVVLFVLWLGALPVLAEQIQRNPRVTHEVRHDVSLPLRDLARMAPKPTPGAIEMREHPSPLHIQKIAGRDPVAQQAFLPNSSTTNLLSFDAIDGNTAGAVPPDTNGSVGSTQYVLITNFDYAVYDKARGNQILAPTRIHTIWTGFGGQCESDDGGDPIVLWDKLAQRWLVEQLEYFSNPNLVCLAVSTTSDATGSYNRYSFSFGNNLPDYPKLGVWPDGYYLSVNSFGFGYGQPCAFDRNAMLAGAAATMICFNPNSSNFGFLPSDLDGATPPPAGVPNHYLELGSNTTSLKEFDFHVDFANPGNSTFTGPHTITIPNYTQPCGAGIGDCVPQPSPGTSVDAIGDRLMYRFAYRNFGDHEALVVNHTVQPGAGSTAATAVRWYELRATPPGSSFKLYQGGTLQHPTLSLWMASIAMDKTGDIVIGGSGSSSTQMPLIGYIGRVPSDPLNRMEAPVIIATSSGVQTGTDRWGDYSSMSLDPADDCTFWYATEYYHADGSDWIAHVNSFKFNRCH